MSQQSAHVRSVNKYNKEHKKKFQASVTPELLERIENYCKHFEITKTEFLRRAIQELD